jgi:hypothetical protein
VSGSGLGTVVLSRNQISAPAQQRVRSDDASHVVKRGSTQAFRAHGQPAALVVGQSHAARPQLLLKHPILFDKVVDRRLLPALDPAGELAGALGEATTSGSSLSSSIMPSPARPR